MISDITIGQYFPAKSIIHALDVRLKICLTIFFIVLCFTAHNFVNLLMVFVLVTISIALSKVSVKNYIKSLKPVIFILIFTSVLNMFYGTGEPIFEWGILKITMGGIYYSIIIVIRILCLILISSVLTFTSSPTQLTDAIERLLKPLSYIKVPVHEFAMMMTIALRFVPTLLEETDKIMSAQKARGADMESGGLMQKIKALVPILIPLFVSAFRRAYDLATAMESRCYTGGHGRTKMKIMKFSKVDYICIGLCVIFLAGFIALLYIVPPIVR